MYDYDICSNSDIHLCYIRCRSYIAFIKQNNDLFNN